MHRIALLVVPACFAATVFAQSPLDTLRELAVAKANKLPAACGMHPHQKAYRPTVYELHRNGRKFPPNYLHESWLDYLYWDTELEP